MTARFRLIAGPNGSGKTTLTRMLAEDYAVNLYTMLNADDFFDNSSSQMRHVASYSAEDGMKKTTDELPEWFKRFII